MLKIREQFDIKHDKFPEYCRGTTPKKDKRRVTYHSNADSHRSFTSAELKIKREADHQTSAEWVTAFGNFTQFHLYIAVSQSSFLQSPGTKAQSFPTSVLFQQTTIITMTKKSQEQTRLHFPPRLACVQLRNKYLPVVLELTHFVGLYYFCGDL